MNKFSEAISKHLNKKLIISTTAGIFVATAVSVPVFAAKTNNTGMVHSTGISLLSTLDACSNFLTTQTQTQYHIFTNANGILHDNERGTWKGVMNREESPITSLSNIGGTYTSDTTISNGLTRGTEELHSSSGNISQRYSISPNNTLKVNVIATGQLSFLTSQYINGKCYTSSTSKS